MNTSSKEQNTKTPRRVSLVDLKPPDNLLFFAKKTLKPVKK